MTEGPNSKVVTKPTSYMVMPKLYTSVFLLVTPGIIVSGLIHLAVLVAHGNAQSGFQVGDTDHENVDARHSCDRVDILHSEL